MEFFDCGSASFFGDCHPRLLNNDLFKLGIFFSTVESLPRNLKILPKKDRFPNELKQ